MSTTALLTTGKASFARNKSSEAKNNQKQAGGPFGAETAPPLDKIPTKDLIEKFLGEEDTMPAGNMTSQGFRSEPPRDSSPTTPRGHSAPTVRRESVISRASSGKVSQHSLAKVKRSRSRTEKEIPIAIEDNDDCETILDVRVRNPPFDETGIETYDAACRKYRALPSATFRRKLAHATSMDLKYYGMGPRGAQAIAIPMVLNTKITTLSLKGNDLSRDGIKYIAKMMTENSYVADLDLSDNNLKSYGANLIAQMLAENTALRKIDLSGNGFNDGDAEIMVKYIEEHGELKTINFANNSFTDRAGNIFRHLIAESSSLQELDLSWNHIRMRGGMEIARGVKENVGIKTLNVAWNGFGDDAAKELGHALKVSTLTNLNLANNRVHAEGFLTLIKSLKDNDDLKVLTLSQNPVTEVAAMAALDFINNLEELRLQVLDLGDIMLSNKFKSRLEEVQENKPDFQCPFGYTDQYGKRKLRHYSVVEEALKAMKDYCVDKNMNIVELFSRFDQDGSMSVTHEEFKEGLRDAKIPLTQLHVDELIKALDQDGDGEIDFSELVLGAEMYDPENKPT